jgi:hypothetical protein
MGTGKETITSDQEMFSSTATAIEKADPAGQYKGAAVLDYMYNPRFVLSRYSGSGEANNVRSGDLTIAQLDDPGVDGLTPDSMGKEYGGPAELQGPGGLPLYNSSTQFNSDQLLWDGDKSFEAPDHPIVYDFENDYSGFIQGFYDAQAKMSDELHDTAANIRKMAAFYETTEDQNKRDVFAVSLPAPYSPPTKS